MLRKQRTLLVATAACAALVVLSTAAGSSAEPFGHVATTAQVLKLVAAAPRITKVPSNLTPRLQDAPNDQAWPMEHSEGCDSPPEKVQMPACVYGDAGGKRTMILFGDSHAAMWLPGFDALAKQAHWKLIFLAKSGCSAPDLHFFDPFRNKYPFKECDEWHAYAISRINHTKPDVLVVSDEFDTPQGAGRRQITPAEWTTGLEKTLRLITSRKTKKVVLGDIPYLPQSAPECLAAHESKVSACSAPADVAVKKPNGQAERTAAAHSGADYVNVVPWFCSKVCTPIIGNMVVYFDAFHITKTYATYLSGALQSSLRAAMR